MLDRMSDKSPDPLSGLPEVLTPEQCADVLQVGASTMRKLLANGTIPSFKLSPRLTRVYRDDLIRFIESSRTPEVSDAEEQGDG
ncbi:MAG: helix-turn-helix domain-containing protein [Kocuria sp.]|nr:helix-turn-helix domain-containing protein [Kocuria sp.]